MKLIEEKMEMEKKEKGTKRQKEKLIWKTEMVNGRLQMAVGDGRGPRLLPMWGLQGWYEHRDFLAGQEWPTPSNRARASRVSKAVGQH